MDDYIKAQLIDSLGRVKNGSFATFGTCPNPANPGIAVNNIGRVGLPLSSRDASAIIEQSRKACFGKGSKTLMNTDVRDTWELDANQFQLENPEWQRTVQDVVERVVDELGVIADVLEVKAEPYKMLLYEKGGKFESHKEYKAKSSEKIPGMFGTLAICLPSEHEGGNVCIKHGRETKVFDTAQSSRFGYSYLAWFAAVLLLLSVALADTPRRYADETHEIETVTKGYRLVLTYNLIRINADARLPCSEAWRKEEGELEKVISSWGDAYCKSQPECPRVLAYVLDHKYTALLSYKYLKGDDQLRVRLLRDVCARSNFSVYLANLERVVEGECDDSGSDDEYRVEYHYIFEVREDYLEVTLFSLDGDLFEKDPPLGLGIDDIVQEDPFGGDPDDEDYSGRTGNEGTTATQFYRHTVVILMPEEASLGLRFYNAKKR